MSSAEEIFDAVATALTRIRTVDGYRTDAGLNPILRGIEMVDEQSPAPIFSIFMPDENLVRERANVHNRDMSATILIAAWAKPLPQDEIQPLFDLRADVRRAVFKYGEVPEIEPLVLDFEYRGASLMPRRAGGTFAQIVFEGFFKWRETV